MIQTERAHMRTAALSHEGMSGKNNEDRFAVTSFILGEENPTPVLFAIVADGIGGHRAGEVAAELAVNHITQAVADSDGKNPRKILTNAIQTASAIIANYSNSEKEKQGMGATCACVWITGDRLYTASVGDSRIYLLREGRIQQLTTDHTWIQEALERNVITPDQARSHPNVHVIRRYLGSPEPPEVDFRMRLYKGQGDTLSENNQGTQLHPGDTLLLCSDGLTDLVWTDEIGEIIRSNHSLKAGAQELVDTANKRGGHDNTTVVLIVAPNDLPPPPERKIPLAWIIGGIAAILITIVFASLLAFNMQRAKNEATPTPTATSASTISIPPTRTALLTRKPPQDTPTAGTTATYRPVTVEPSYTPWPTNTPREPAVAPTETPAP
jgi:protein phosphatase